MEQYKHPQQKNWTNCGKCDLLLSASITTTKVLMAMIIP